MNDRLRSLGRVLAGTILPRTAYPVIRGPLKGARFILGTVAGGGGGATVYVNLSEPEQTAAFAAAVHPGDIVFDVGANVGYYTVLGSRLVGPEGKVVAFEPLIRNVSFLYRHVRLNRATNVTILAAACSDRLSLATFRRGMNHATGHLTDTAGLLNPEDRFPVPTITIDDVVRSLEVRPNVMKVDVEGAELSVLRGARMTLAEARPTVLLSTHSAALREDCVRLLADAGFSCRELSTDGAESAELLARPARHP